MSLTQWKIKISTRFLFYSIYTTVDCLRKKNHSIKSSSASTTALILCITREQARVTLYKAWQWKRTNEYFQPLITSIKVHQFSKVIRVLKSAHPQLFVGGVYFYFLLRIFMLDSAEVNFCRKTAAKNLLHQLSSIKKRKRK